MWQNSKQGGGGFYKPMTIVLGGLLFFLTGCPEPSKGRINAPPQGHSAIRSDMGDNSVYMTDNALLKDMSVSDVHFWPRHAELNATGARRLNRMAKLLKIYGGTVFYSGVEDEESFAEERIQVIKEYLLAQGAKADQFCVRRGLAGSKGMRASESMAIRDETTGPKTGQSMPLMGGLSSGGQ